MRKEETIINLLRPSRGNFCGLRVETFAAFAWNFLFLAKFVSKNPDYSWG